MGKMAKPVGLIVECPYCKMDNEIQSNDLMVNDFECQHADCLKLFSTCGDDDFYRYIENKC